MSAPVKECFCINNSPIKNNKKFLAERTEFTKLSVSFIFSFVHSSEFYERVRRQSGKSHMKMIMISYNEAVNMEIMEIFDTCGLKNYTKIGESIRPGLKNGVNKERSTRHCQASL